MFGKRMLQDCKVHLQGVITGVPNLAKLPISSVSGNNQIPGIPTDIVDYK